MCPLAMRACFFQKVGVCQRRGSFRRRTWLCRGSKLAPPQAPEREALLSVQEALG